MDPPIPLNKKTHYLIPMKGSHFEGEKCCRIKQNKGEMGICHKALQEPLAIIPPHL